jgi:nitroreductase
MEFSELIKKRRSVRAYKDKAISEKDLNKLLEMANSAPSAGNLQAYNILVVKDKEKKSLLADAAYGQRFIEQAPIVLVFVAMPSISSKRYRLRGKELYSIQDATMAGAYAQLAAENLGLSSVWVGSFDEVKVRKIFGLAHDAKPISIIPIGYALKDPPKMPRRKLGEGIHYF